MNAKKAAQKIVDMHVGLAHRPHRLMFGKESLQAAIVEALRTARREALEEAAKFTAEEFSTGVALERIRALLKTKDGEK